MVGLAMFARFDPACNFFLWGYLKLLLYQQKPKDVTDDLKQKITDACTSTDQEIMEGVTAPFHNVFENLQRAVLKIQIGLALAAMNLAKHHFAQTLF